MYCSWSIWIPLWCPGPKPQLLLATWQVGTDNVNMRIQMGNKCKISPFMETNFQPVLKHRQGTDVFGMWRACKQLFLNSFRLAFLFFCLFSFHAETQVTLWTVSVWAFGFLFLLVTESPFFWVSWHSFFYFSACLLILNVILFSSFHTSVIPPFSRKHSGLPVCLKSASAIHFFFHKYLWHFSLSTSSCAKQSDTYWTKTHMIPILRL